MLCRTTCLNIIRSIVRRDDLNKQKIQDLIDLRQEQRADIYKIERESEDAFKINGHPYRVLIDYKNAFDIDKLADRYSTILSKYDYIVGDWGFDQLRLKGFYSEGNHQTQILQSEDDIQDYLYEYCNFGCAYFIIQNLDVQIPSEHQKRRHPKNTSHNSHEKNDKNVNGHDKRKTNSQNKNHRSARSNTAHKRANNNAKHGSTPQIRERRRKVSQPSVGKRHDQEAVRVDENKKQQRFVIRHK